MKLFHIDATNLWQRHCRIAIKDTMGALRRYRQWLGHAMAELGRGGIGKVRVSQ